MVIAMEFIRGKFLKLLSCFRLHNDPSGNTNNTTPAVNQPHLVRKRRHQIRTVLLVLDYAMEFIGGIFLVAVVFVGDTIFYHRVLFCIGTFVYGCLIPIAYLLNESRVRTTILDHGWIRGFRSIFYSAATIRENDRKSARQARGQNAEQKDDGFNGILLQKQEEEGELD